MLQSPSTFSEYSSNAVGPTTAIGSPSVQEEDDVAYWSLSKLKRCYSDYVSDKNNEITEQQQARRYRHGAHWTADQVKVFNERKQPVVTFNRIGRKIDGVVGLIERLRQDPKAYPRTPQGEQGADLATAVLRYVLDAGDWRGKSPQATESGAVDGIGGIEIVIEQGDHGDPDIGFDVLEIENFFYDPRSTRPDFDDSRYHGIGKWVTLDAAKEMFPDKAEELQSSTGDADELTSNSDKEKRWFQSIGRVKMVRIVDLWYRHQGGWCYCIFTGSMKIMEGKSYLFDEKGKPISKYVIYSAFVDHDGDRYGFVRNLKSANDEINMRRSKGLHQLNSRRIRAETGAFDNIEKARVEAARPDGVVIYNRGYQIDFDDTARVADIEGQVRFLEDAKAEIENFGPNPALAGEGVANRSGRAISLMQQAGIAELGPFMISFRQWKIRVYRALFNAAQRFWTGERWIRVTDDEGVAQFVSVNQLGVDPMTGMPTILNAIGSLDVDIILDEGPDQINSMADTFDTLTVLAQSGQQVPLELLIETSALPGSVKKKWIEKLSQPNPQLEQAKQIELQKGAAEVQETQTQAVLNMAKAREAMMPEPPQIVGGGAQEGPGPMFVAAQAMADIQDTHAATELKRAQARTAEAKARAADADAMFEPLYAEQALLNSQQNLAKQQTDLQREKNRPPPANGGGARR